MLRRIIVIILLTCISSFSVLAQDFNDYQSDEYLSLINDRNIEGIKNFFRTKNRYIRNEEAVFSGIYNRIPLSENIDEAKVLFSVLESYSEEDRRKYSKFDFYYTKVKLVYLNKMSLIIMESDDPIEIDKFLESAKGVSVIGLDNRIKLERRMKSLYWKKALDSNDDNEISTFINRFPDYEPAKRYITEKEFNIAKEAADIDALKQFIDNNPSSSFSVSAQVEIDRLMKLDADRESDRINNEWILALDRNTIMSYENFIENNPDSKFSEIALKKINILKWKETDTYKDIIQKINNQWLDKKLVVRSGVLDLGETTLKDFFVRPFENEIDNTKNRISRYDKIDFDNETGVVKIEILENEKVLYIFQLYIKDVGTLAFVSKIIVTDNRINSSETAESFQTKLHVISAIDSLYY